MRLRAPFWRDADYGREIRVVDLLLAALVAFLIAPITLGVLGSIVLWLSEKLAFSALEILAAPFLVAAYTGVFAWIGAPFAIVIGRWASRKGLVGWGHAALSGASVAMLAVLILVSPNIDWLWRAPESAPWLLSFALAGAVYGVLFWRATVFLRPDLQDTAPR